MIYIVLAVILLGIAVPVFLVGRHKDIPVESSGDEHTERPATENESSETLRHRLGMLETLLSVEDRFPGECGWSDRKEPRDTFRFNDGEHAATDFHFLPDGWLAVLARINPHRSSCIHCGLSLQNQSVKNQNDVSPKSGQ